MTLQDALRAYLDTSGESMRSLSLRAGLGAKAVADILSGKSRYPTPRTVAALTDATGTPLPAPEPEQRMTYAALFRALREGARDEAAAKQAERRISRLTWLLRNANWIAETTMVDRQAVIAFFAANTPATFGLKKSSYATYKYDILEVIDTATGRGRKRTIDDIAGPYRAIQDRVRQSDLPLDLKNNAGSFFVYLHDEGIAPGEITTDTLAAYFEHRLSVARTTEKTCRKHVKRVAALLARLTRDPDFAEYGFAAPPHPFPDTRDKFGISEATIAPLIAEFDRRVAPWVLGEMSRDGLSRAEFIAVLDRAVVEEDPRKARLQARKRARGKRSKDARRNEKLSESGFLLPNQQWSERTLATRRAQIVALAKALAAETGYVIDTLEDLTDPDVVEEAADILAEINAGEFPSSYVAVVLKTIRKIAVGLVGREAADLDALSELIEAHATDETAMSERNLAKLRAFTETQIGAFLDLSSKMLNDLNAEVDRRRRQQKRETGRRPARLEVYDRALAQRVMLVLAHDILLTRAPRRGNVTAIRLDWIRWREGCATIVVPSIGVKGRDGQDPDLLIPLGPAQSDLLRVFIDRIRAKALLDGDEENPFLFPIQDIGGSRRNQPYKALLDRLCREVHVRIGVRINPHLYRHLIGWIWLREDPDRLPEVQKLLGHKRLETTLKFYIALDESLALQRWQDHINERQKRPDRLRARLAA
ncbi:site-specific integrase [Rhodovulum adriaticum]|uniref:Phage integrase family protein n=1 Tax=Rhodovulum adriaticum TaxID=35804 RepID=A0A4R2P078_RHOAD|nr:site-specific integrase [Rhodovulum adriaticum]MBK1634157.1 hypothetical protein [Rhodovulum adriaticum]TCP27294.1 phage integrase family protein [Rhodovulum adriaticum]